MYYNNHQTYQNSDIQFNRKGIHIVNLNIRHVKSKLDERKIILNSTKHIDVFGLCETFLSESVDNDILNIDSYTIERKDRHENNTASANKGGEVVVYLSINLNYIRRKDIESPNIESIWVEIMLGNSKSFLICSVYRPPTSAVEWYEMFSKQIEKSSSLCVVKFISWVILV